jgi:polysaccharide pyruvyl transferase WcaK-like protein
MDMAIKGRVALLDHMGGGNLGDDATQTAVIQNIRRRRPGADIIGLSMNPADTRSRHGIPAYAIRRSTWVGGPVRGGFNSAEVAQTEKRALSLKARLRAVVSRHRVLLRVLTLINLVVVRAPKELCLELVFLRRSLAIVKSCDLLVISGGGQLLDCWGGPWGFPYTIWKWIVLAKMSKVGRIFLNVGAGPLDYRLSFFFVSQASRLANYMSFRDHNSKLLVQRIGFRGKSEVVTDNVYGLELPSCATESMTDHGGSIIGISPMAYCHPALYWKKDRNSYDSFIGKLAAFGSALIGSGYRIVLFTSDIGFDRQTVQDLKKTLESKLGTARKSWIESEVVDTTEQLLRAMSFMDYVVTCRFHGVVFAHLLNKPVLALSHHPKVTTLMNDIGLADYCVDIESFDPDSISNKFALLVKNADQIKETMADVLARYRSRLAHQFDDLFPPSLREAREVAGRQ